MAERMTAATAIIQGGIEAYPKVEGATLINDRLKTDDCEWSILLPNTRGEVLVTCESPATLIINNEVLSNTKRVKIVMGDGGEVLRIE